MGCRIQETTAQDYAWLHEWPFGGLGEGYCFTFVHGLGKAEALRRFGCERSQPREATWFGPDSEGWGERFELGRVADEHLVAATLSDGWAVVVEPNGFEGVRPEVLRAVSRGTRCVAVHHSGNAAGQFAHAVNGTVLTEFEPRDPRWRRGTQPDLLLPSMRATGLDPDHPDRIVTPNLAALVLAHRVTGVALTLALLQRPVLEARIVPLLPDPPLRSYLQGRDAPLDAAIGAAGPGTLRAAAVAVAARLAAIAGLERDPTVAEALRTAAAGRASRVDDRSPLGQAIRWKMDGGDRPSPWRQHVDLGQPLLTAWELDAITTARRRWCALRAVYATSFADPRVAAYEAFQAATPLPRDIADAARDAALAILATGGDGRRP